MRDPMKSKVEDFKYLSQDAVLRKLDDTLKAEATLEAILAGIEREIEALLQKKERGEDREERIEREMYNSGVAQALHVIRSKAVPT